MSQEVGAALGQAGAVCLERSGHAIGTFLLPRGILATQYRLSWVPATMQARRSWNDDEETTEHGAAGIATLLANLELHCEVVLRSRKGTGFDYWLGDRFVGEVSEAEQAVTAGWAELLLDGGLVIRARMEVSGIRNGNDSRIAARVNGKLDQISASDYMQIPAYVVVLEFGRPIAEVRRK